MSSCESLDSYSCPSKHSSLPDPEYGDHVERIAALLMSHAQPEYERLLFDFDDAKLAYDIVDEAIIKTIVCTLLFYLYLSLIFPY